MHTTQFKKRQPNSNLASTLPARAWEREEGRGVSNGRGVHCVLFLFFSMAKANKQISQWGFSLRKLIRQQKWYWRIKSNDWMDRMDGSIMLIDIIEMCVDGWHATHVKEIWYSEWREKKKEYSFRDIRKLEKNEPCSEGSAREIGKKNPLANTIQMSATFVKHRSNRTKKSHRAKKKVEKNSRSHRMKKGHKISGCNVHCDCNNTDSLIYLLLICSDVLLCAISSMHFVDVIRMGGRKGGGGEGAHEFFFSIHLEYIFHVSHCNLQFGRCAGTR